VSKGGTSLYTVLLVVIATLIVPNRALHLAIIHNHQDVVLQLLDVLPQLPPTETPVVDCLNNLKQVKGDHKYKLKMENNVEFI